MDQKMQMTWKCTQCGYTYNADRPHEKCPSCGQQCEHVDVTCYTPECSGTGQDPRLG